MRRPARLAAAALVLACGCSGGDDGGDATPTTAATTTTPTATTTTTVAGIDAAPGLDDPYLPALGGAGLDVTAYDLVLMFPADGSTIDGTATLRIEATADLASFTLDLLGPSVESVRVDGEPAGFEHAGGELRIRPESAVPSGETFTVEVEYGGTPGTAENPILGAVGWTRAGDMAFAASEPDGARTWFPSNDHPSDKATYRFEITVPEGVEAVATGVLVDQVTAGGATTWTWEMDDPMATYLASVAVGQFTLSEQPDAAGVDIRNAIADGVGDVPGLARQPEMLAFFSEVFGPYPFDAYGALVVDVPLGFALETQTLSLFSAGFADEPVVAHELVHQWYGDSVTPETWRDIWLNEGFATYGEWLWNEHTGGVPVAETARNLQAAGFGDGVPPGDPGLDNLFHPSVYIRGGLTLQALRLTVGDEPFFEILRRWATDNAGDSVSTQDFVALAEEVSGAQLDELFDAWLYQRPLPDLPGG